MVAPALARKRATSQRGEREAPASGPDMEVLESHPACDLGGHRRDWDKTWGFWVRPAAPDLALAWEVLTGSGDTSCQDVPGDGCLAQI